MAGPGLVSYPYGMTSAWLTEALRASDLDATVTGFAAEPIGTGQLGENIRFTLQGFGDLPATVVGKFPSPDPVSRETGVRLKWAPLYQSNVMFLFLIGRTISTRKTITYASV